jgi:uncharacterized membrane protein (UPF0127 family)
MKNKVRGVPTVYTLLSTVFCLLFSACGAKAPPAAPAVTPAALATPTPEFKRGRVTIQARSGPLTLQVEIADDEPKREYGLMNRRQLPPDAGMLFVFNPPADPKLIGFWMKDTLLPLSIAFVEPNMAIESLQEMAALSEEVHHAPRPYAYAIEANQGYFSQHGVAVGDTITINA